MEYGYFDDANYEYVITNPRTPAKWINYVGTLAFGGLVDHTGGALICAQDPALNRILKYIPQMPDSDFKGETLYLRIRSAAGGYAVFSPFFVPTLDALDSYECRVGLSYQKITSVYMGIETEVTIFVPPGEQAQPSPPMPPRRLAPPKSKLLSVKGRPAWLEPTNLLKQAGGLRDTKLGWQKYRSYLEFLGTDDSQKKEMVSERMSRGWCLGTKTFVREMKDEAIKRGARLDLESFEGLEPDEIKDTRELHWEELLSKAADLSGIDLKQLPAAKMAPEKSCLAAVMKQASTAPNRWIADKLEIGNPATASQCAHRWLLDNAQKLKVERLVKRLCV